MSERRQTERRALPRSCKASFEHEGRSHDAVMVDISDEGAGLVVFRPDWRCAPRVGAAMLMQLITPDGTLQRQGRVVWVDVVTGGRRFGVSFEARP